MIDQNKKCNGTKCVIKNLCKRHKMKINPFKQEWIDSKYIEDKGCKNFINNKE